MSPGCRMCSRARRPCSSGGGGAEKSLPVSWRGVGTIANEILSRLGLRLERIVTGSSPPRWMAGNYFFLYTAEDVDNQKSI